MQMQENLANDWKTACQKDASLEESSRKKDEFREVAS
jgi:hypothetical protein